MNGLLIDENLPASLSLGETFPIHHVQEFGPRLSDSEIWSLAREKHWVLLTKDADFFGKVMLEGPPPKIVWLRIGNMRRAELKMFLQNVWPDILEMIGQADLVEVHPGHLEAVSR